MSRQQSSSPLDPLASGSNRAAAETTLATFPKPSLPGVSHDDITSMKNVHCVAGELTARTPKINFLVLTPGCSRCRKVRLIARPWESAGVGQRAALSPVGSGAGGSRNNTNTRGLRNRNSHLLFARAHLRLPASASTSTRWILVLVADAPFKY
ncbi:hypothetical protein B0H16DRAFT_1408751 [Mycena metata]|uniref:Uncharacterized protein n=1 Tax=Mycena metata TaxID=1033252 RepID=A0AAD7JZS1_9AGAR|nr:hypothetical protein B0H16DRAFT_1408751 [Mycena metata]